MHVLGEGGARGAEANASSDAAKNSKLAKASFDKATAQWEKVKSQHGDDDVIEAGLRTRDRRAKLK